MKTVLCISPHFPPINAPDMQRLRQSLPFFKEFGWKPVVFAVDPDRVEGGRDRLLLETVPYDVEVHQVGAFESKLTRKVGLGNLGFRCFLQLRRAVEAYLAQNPVDLIYFTTTVFTVVALGRRWKDKFGVPFVVDLQDPWRNDYYLALPTGQRPGKFWFDYRQKKLLEARTMPHADGILAVSSNYIDTLLDRYPVLKHVPTQTLPFAGLARDFDVAANLPAAPAAPDITRLVYAGRGGRDMETSLSGLFQAIAWGLEKYPERYARLRLEFFGTSYAVNGQGSPSIQPVAQRYGLADMVREQTDRLPYFQTLRTLLDADVLVIPGSDDPAYTASKIFPYILAKKPLLAIFSRQSSVIEIVRATGAGEAVAFSEDSTVEDIAADCLACLDRLLDQVPFQPETDWVAFEPYSAREMTRKTADLFNRIHEKSR